MKRTWNAIIVTGALALALGVPALIGASAIKTGEAAGIKRPATGLTCYTNCYPSGCITTCF